MIELSGITKVYNAGLSNEYAALRGVTLTLVPGQVTALVGPSGSGKSTLLSILGCMSRPTTGRVHIQGREVTSLPERFLTEVRRRTFGFIFQQYNLITGLTALENAILPGYPTGEAHKDIERRALALFERFGLLHRAEARVEWLSGGEAQRVAIVRALINDPEVLIADEPTAHLDSKLSGELIALLGDLNREAGKTLVITSHDPEVYGAGMVHRIVRMHDGRLEQGQ